MWGLGNWNNLLELYITQEFSSYGLSGATFTPLYL